MLDEGRPALDVGFLREALEKPVGGEGDLEGEPGEQIPQLAHLTGVPGGDEQLHGSPHRHGADAARRRASSSVVEYPGTSATRTTRPPRLSTSRAPTICSGA